MPLLILAYLTVFSDQLDGIRKRSTSESSPQHMSDYLQLPDDYETRKYAPGKKRVSKQVYYTMTVKYLNHTKPDFNKASCKYCIKPCDNLGSMG